MTGDHFHHFTAIGAYMGIKPDAARHLAKTQGLPTFRLGKTVAASRTEIDAWLNERRGAARATPPT